MEHSACIEMLFPELSFLDRIGAARGKGFTHIEFWLWKNKNIDAIGERLSKENMKIGVFQGNTDGRMVDFEDHNCYCDGVRESMQIAKKLGAGYLFCMTDILREDRTVAPPVREIAPQEKEAAVNAVLAELAPEAERAGITLLIEPLNTLVDHSGYFIERSEVAWRIHHAVNHENVKVLYDIYHMQIMEGNIIDTIRRHISSIGYIHVADVPGRHEPGTGELNFRNVAKAITDSGYEGIIGYEFEPTGSTADALIEARIAFNF